MTSTRLPGKVFLPISGTPLLLRVLDRVQRIDGIDEIVVAIPEGAVHDPITDLVRRKPAIRVARGPEQDVLKRTRIAAEHCGADIVVRITSDCPFIDKDASEAVLEAFHSKKALFASTALESGYPLGFDTETIAMTALRAADEEARDPYEREHVTPFIWRRPDRFPSTYVDHQPDLRSWRMVVDTREDLQFAEAVYAALLPKTPDFGLAELRQLFADHPELLELNRGVRQTPYAGLPSA